MKKNNLSTAGLTTAPLCVPPGSVTEFRPPETFRLPRANERDPYFSLSRAYYYEAEKAGLIKLIRLRKQGRMRGVTLISYQDVANLIRRSATAQ